MLGAFLDDNSVPPAFLGGSTAATPGSSAVAMVATMGLPTTAPALLMPMELSTTFALHAHRALGAHHGDAGGGPGRLTSAPRCLEPMTA